MNLVVVVSKVNLISLNPNACDECRDHEKYSPSLIF